MNINNSFIIIIACCLSATGGQYILEATDAVSKTNNGSAISGNEFYGGYADQEFTIDSYANNNTATSQFGATTAGNDIGIGQTFGAKFWVDNNASYNFALNKYLDAVSGNRFTGGSIGSGGVYGGPSNATIQQTASRNGATSVNTFALSGNQVNIDSVNGSNISIQNKAEKSYATTSLGNTTISGNVNILGNISDPDSGYQDYGDNDIIINNFAQYTFAGTRYGTATSGNLNQIESIIKTDLNIKNDAIRSDAVVRDDGVALAGNLNQVEYVETGANGKAKLQIQNNAELNDASISVGQGLAISGNYNKVQGDGVTLGRLQDRAVGNIADAVNGDSVAGNKNIFGGKTTDKISTLAEGNYAITASGDAVSGNDNTFSQIFFRTDQVYTEANNNYAETGSGDAVSGNRNVVDVIYEGNLQSQAKNNRAYSGGSGEAVSGNQLNIVGDGDSTNYFSNNNFVDSIDMNAQNNKAVAEGDSDAIAGNVLTSASNIGYESSTEMVSRGNTATSEEGDAISGNVVRLGHLS